MTKTESRILVQVDSKAYTQKPDGKEIGGVKTRTQNSKAQNLTIEKLATEIGQGKSFSPGILEGGLGASNWKEQQIFGVDIDNNDETLPILTPKEAMKICKDNGVPPALCYKTFSSSKEKPKFRLMFKLNEPVKDEGKRLIVASTLVALFPQADKSCVNADRIFFGTNKKVVILNKTVSFDKILEVSGKQIAPAKELTELDKLKAEFDFENFLNEACVKITRKTETYIMYKNCPICGHHDDFIYYKKSRTFKCFGAHGGAGGSIIDYLMATRNLSQKQAIDCFKNELCRLPRSKNDDKKEVQQLELISAEQLIKQKLAPINWCIEDFLPQGLALVVAQPKVGKSWLTLAICLSVATGIDFLGYHTNKGESLYLALEDSRHRLKNRLGKILGENEIPKNFNFVIKAPSLANGLIDMLEKHMQEHPATKLIAIDTLQKIRTGATKQEGAYDEQVADMLDCLKSEPLMYMTMIYLAIDIGLREGELTGLKWEDINFDTCEININKQRHYITGYGNIEGRPKTDAGIRTVTASKTVISLLKEYKKQQNENRLKFGTAWQNGKYVFLHEDGSPISTQLPYKWFTKFLNRYNLPKITFHQLRHTNASLLISSGEDIVTVSGRLGHADKNVTLNTYSHIIKSKEAQVANKMDEFYQSLNVV